MFLLGGWRDGVEITEDLINAGNSWEEKVNNFFIKMKDPAALQNSPTSPDTSLGSALVEAMKTTYDHLCNSFNTSGVMFTISELITKYNSADKSTLPSEDVEAAARWVTSIVNTFGLNGAAPANTQEIGWSGIDIPEEAKPFLFPLSVMRDSLRQGARAKGGFSPQQIAEIVERESVPDQDVALTAKPYAAVYSDFCNKVSSLESSDNLDKEVLALCDRVRNIDLFDLGIYLEDRDNQPALVRPVTRELIQAREEKEARARQKQIERENKEKEALQRLEKGKLSHLDMFRTNEYSAWDEEGIPTKDAAGGEINKSKTKKLRKDWERQKKLHETWLGSQMGSK